MLEELAQFPAVGQAALGTTFTWLLTAPGALAGFMLMMVLDIALG